MKRLDEPNWKKQSKKKRLLWTIGLSVLVTVPLLIGSAYILKKTFARSPVVGDTHLAEPEIQGNRIFVRKGDSFQSALNRANPGDTILLQKGVTFKGAFKLPKKSGSEYITIRTSADDSELPDSAHRIDPEKHSAILPKLESNVKGAPVILASDGAHHFRFVGVEFLPTIEGLYNIIQIGTSEETKIEQLPHHIEFDRVYIHGSKTHGQRRGIAANGRHIKIVNSYISEIKRRGDESQAIAAWSTDGPIEIRNNYLEAAAIGILFGGAGAPLELIPTDCLVKDNHINKPIEWKGTDWVVKNMFEIKNGRNIKVQNNLMTNNWAMGQSGTAIVFTTRADNKNTVIDNIEFSGNIVRSSGNAINVYGSEGAGGKNLVIRNNLFADINGARWGGAGHFMITTEWDGLTIENNTILQTGNISNAYGKPVKRFVFRNNIISQNEYGFFGDGSSPGMKSVRSYFPQAKIENNVIIGSNASVYGRSNFYPASKRQIGFENFKSYRLRQESPYRRKGIGANLRITEVGGN